MSLHFDLMISCDLLENTPDSYIKAIQCLTDRNIILDEQPQLFYPGYGNIWEGFYDIHFLAPDPDREIISNFQRVWRESKPEGEKIFRYSLQYSGRWIHDDRFASHHMPFLYWLASIAKPSFIGYYGEHDFYRPAQLVVENAQLAFVGGDVIF